jgi:hypothetical protein
MKKLLKKIYFIIVIVLAVGLTMVLGSCVISDETASNDIVIACAKTEVDKILKSSSTARWGAGEIVDKDSYGRYLVYLPLEAQNGFGGYNKLYYMVIVKDVTVDGHYKALTYNSRLELPNLTGSTIPSVVTQYKNGETVKILQDFLDVNKWGQPDSNSSNE